VEAYWQIYSEIVQIILYRIWKIFIVHISEVDEYSLFLEIIPGWVESEIIFLLYDDLF
jgi:hypothetical protein